MKYLIFDTHEQATEFNERCGQAANLAYWSGQGVTRWLFMQCLCDNGNCIVSVPETEDYTQHLTEQEIAALKTKAEVDVLHPDLDWENDLNLCE